MTNRGEKEEVNNGEKEEAKRERERYEKTG